MKKLNTNSKEVKEAVNIHILYCMYDYLENEFKTLKEACIHLNSEFERVANNANNLKRFPNNVDRFTDYLQGIPFHFHYSNEDLKEFLNSLGINPENKEYSSQKMWALYGLLIYRQMTKNL